MKKLIRVVRGRPDNGTPFELFHEQVNFPLRRAPEAIIPVMELEIEQSNFQKSVEFCLVDDRDVEGSVALLAHNNPGCEVRVYACEQIAQCPAAPMVVKKIDQSGILPG